jgi:quinol monooxygenase YgiN
MRGARQRDDGWDEGRRDSWQNGTAYQPDTAAGYAGSGYPNGAGYAGSDNQAFPAGYGDQASGAAGQGAAGQGYDTRGYDPNGYPDSGYPGSGQSAAGYGGGGYDSAGYSGSTGYSGGGFSANGYDASGTSGYADRGYAQPGYAPAGASGQYGWASSSPGSEFLPADESASENDNAAGTPRPYGRLSIFTLLDDKAAEFDRLAERAAEGVRTAEPDTLVYVIHVVPKAPMQRIIYEIYRDRAAFQSHEQQPHIQRFVADRRSCVLATNIIDLRLKYAKVAALATAQAPEAAAAPGFGQETQLDRVPAGLGSGDRYAANGYSAANGQYQSHDRYAAAGYQANGQYQATGQYQAAEQYQAPGTGQYAASDQYAAPAAPQYTPTSQYAAGNGQYGNGQLSSGGQYGSGQYSDGQYSDGQYSNGQYSNGNYGSGQYAAAGSGRQQGSGRYPELGSGRQPDGGGRHAETTGGYGQAGGYGRTGGYTQDGGQVSEPDSDTGTEARTPRFEPAEWDRTASRAGRY